MDRESLRTQSLRILLVDDDEEDLSLFTSALLKAGVCNEIFQVRDGQECLDFLRGDGPYAAPDARNPMPDLVLMDFVMPRMDGIRAVREIRADPELRHLPVIMISGMEENERVRTAYVEGANSFLVKPGDYARLVEMATNLQDYWARTVCLGRRQAGAE